MCTFEPWFVCTDRGLTTHTLLTQQRTMKAMQGEKVEEPTADAPEDAETAHVDEVTRQEPAQEARKRVASGS